MQNQVLTNRERRLIALLSDGQAHSVIEIANRLNIGDPRASIRDLRNKGVKVEDRWVNGDENHYKVYFIKR